MTIIDENKCYKTRTVTPWGNRQKKKITIEKANFLSAIIRFYIRYRIFSRVRGNLQLASTKLPFSLYR